MTTPFKKFFGVVLGTAPGPALREAPGPAEVRLGKIPDVVDTAAWYEVHAQLCYDLQAAAVRASRDPNAEAEVGKAHSALLAHAAIINGGNGPVLLSKNGEYRIPFERLAAARAKVKVLEAENARLRSAQGCSDG